MSPWRDFSGAARRCLLAALTLVCTGGMTSLARADRETIVDVQVGFAGKYKVGYWTPIRIRLYAGNENAIPDFSLVVPDGDGVPSRVKLDDGGVPITTSGQEVTCRGFVKFGQANDTLQIETTDASGRELSETLRQGSERLANPLPAGRELVVIVGAAPSESRAATADLDNGWGADVARVSDIAELPDQWYGYEGVDRLVLVSDRPEIFKSLEGQRLAALEQWVRLGGRLVLSLDGAGSELLAEGSPLARFAPGKFSQTIPLRQSASLETYAGTSERLDRLVDRGAFRLDVPKLVDVHGRIEAYEGNHPRDLPLVVRSAFGLGEVLFVGIDIERAPVSRWRARGAFIARLLARPEAAEATSDERVLGRVTELGYTDLVGQLHMALSQFAGVVLLPFAAVAALLAVYIICIGPLDWLFLKRFVRRMEWTWLTFPAIVLVFSGGTFAAAHWLKGNKLRLNQVDLVDVDAESKTIRGTSWSTIFSPRIDTFDLGLRIDPSEVRPQDKPRVLLSWLAVPGSGLAGAGRAAGAAMFTHPYDFSPTLDRVEHLPIAQWSTRSLVGRWWAEGESPLSAKLVDRGDHLLSGTLTLPAVWPLSDGVLLYDRWAYPLSAIDSGTIDVDRQLEPQTAETFFRHVATIDEKNVHPPYDRSSTDLASILEAMMFHDLIGGEAFTRLSGQAQSYVDLSGALRVGRAVLVGRSVEPATTLVHRTEAEGNSAEAAAHDLVDSEARRLTFYRFVLPVEQRSAD